MVKFYTKNPEFWYKICHISPNIWFYKNRTSSGYNFGYTELGEQSKEHKQPLVHSGDSKPFKLTCRTHKPEREGNFRWKLRKGKIHEHSLQTLNHTGPHQHANGSQRPRPTTEKPIWVGFLNQRNWTLHYIRTRLMWTMFKLYIQSTRTESTET